MKKALQPTHKAPQKPASESSAARLGAQAAEVRTPGALGRLAASINQSPRVQTQLKLANQLQSGAQNRKSLELAGAMTHGVAQAKDKEKLQRVVDKKTPKIPTTQSMSAQRKEEPAANRTGLPDQLKTGVETLSGISLDDVKVHYNSAQPAQLNALAYAQGTDIHVAPGQEKHLAHEAWHIVQQAQGRVQPTTQMKAGVAVNDDPKLEHEADVMGAEAAQRKARSSIGNDSTSEETEPEADGHARGCACPACSGTRQLIAHPPAQLLASGRGVAQLECEYCKAIGKDADHTIKNCPYFAEEEPEEAAPAGSADGKEGKEKVPGWKKGGGAPTGRINRSGISHHDIGKDKSKSKKERDRTGGRKGKKRQYN